MNDDHNRLRRARSCNQLPCAPCNVHRLDPSRGGATIDGPLKTALITRYLCGQRLPQQLPPCVRKILGRKIEGNMSDIVIEAIAVTVLAVIYWGRATGYY